MSKGVVSVVIPSYNHKQFIKKAITSVITQNYRPLELIIIDDGSKDGSGDFVRALIPQIKRAKVKVTFIERENRGAHNTINEGLSLAKGDWLTILNSDDYYLPGRISALLKACIKSKSEFAFTDTVHIDDNENLIEDTHPFRDWYLRNRAKAYPSLGFRFLDCNCAITTGNFFFSKELFKTVGEFRNYTILHDYDFILRSLAYTEPVHIPKNLIAYRVHRENTISEHFHLNVTEGPRLAADFILNTLIHTVPRNKRAPWAKGSLKNYEKFWRNPAAGSLRSWLGDRNLMNLY